MRDSGDLSCENSTGKGRDREVDASTFGNSRSVALGNRYNHPESGESFNSHHRKGSSCGAGGSNQSSWMNIAFSDEPIKRGPHLEVSFDLGNCLKSLSGRSYVLLLRFHLGSICLSGFLRDEQIIARHNSGCSRGCLEMLIGALVRCDFGLGGSELSLCNLKLGLRFGSLGYKFGSFEPDDQLTRPNSRAA